jgi:hypothetical protein
MFLSLHCMSRDSSVDIVTGYGPDAGVRVLEGVRDVSLLHIGQTVSGAQPASYAMNIGDSFLGVK